MERNAKFQWIFCLLLGCATSLVAQNVANWGLTHPQPKETLPKSKAQIMMPTPKTQTLVEAVVEKIGENDFLLNRGWVQINPDNRLIIRVFSFCKAY